MTYVDSEVLGPVPSAADSVSPVPFQRVRGAVPSRDGVIPRVPDPVLRDGTGGVGRGAVFRLHVPARRGAGDGHLPVPRLQVRRPARGERLDTGFAAGRAGRVIILVVLGAPSLDC